MNEQKQYVCPWCGGKDVVEGIQSTYAKVQPNKALTLKGENLIHAICKNCGTAVRSYVENPQSSNKAEHFQTGGQLFLSSLKYYADYVNRLSGIYNSYL